MSTMTAFPPSLGWVVLEEEEFFTYSPINNTGETEIAVLVQVGDDGGQSGGFRIALGGAALRASFPAAALLPLTGMKEFQLELVRKPEEIYFRRNGITSDWMDLDQR